MCNLSGTSLLETVSCDHLLWSHFLPYLYLWMDRVPMQSSMSMLQRTICRCCSEVSLMLHHYQGHDTLPHDTHSHTHTPPRHPSHVCIQSTHTPCTRTTREHPHHTHTILTHPPHTSTDSLTHSKLNIRARAPLYHTTLTPTLTRRPDTHRTFAYSPHTHHALMQHVIR